MPVVVEPAEPGAQPASAAYVLTAWELGATRRAYAAYRLGALRWLLGGVAGLVLAVGLSAYAVLVLRRPGLGVVIVAALILGVVGVATGGGGLLRARQFRAALRRSSWQRAELRVAGSHLRLVFDDGCDHDTARDRDTAHDLDLDHGRDVDARLMSTSRWRVREVVGHRDSEVLICPAAEGRYVLTAVGSVNLYGLVAIGNGLGFGGVTGAEPPVCGAPATEHDLASVCEDRR